MNLQPLYDVKDRLEYAAIAGANLLAEDFRLQRAAENLKPLAAASPVFGKISAGLDKLLAAPAEQRSALLLDVLALVDAVVYTQASSGVSGELEPLPAGNGTAQEISYTQLHPLLDALTGTGGGRMRQIESIWEDHPEFFGDYRVLPVLADHLGESYAELADLLFEIAAAQGPAVIPLLKRGFDPAGKRDMVRRVQLMDAVAGGTENDWYLSQLPQSKKAVREALIFALRHCPENGERLLELCQTEKKDCQAAAYWALARLDTPDAAGYWRSLAVKDQNTVLDYLRLSPTRTAAVVTAGLFGQNLDTFGPNLPLDGAVAERIDKLRLALDRKTGPEICEIYRRAAALSTAMDRDADVERNGQTKREPMGFWCFSAATTNEWARRPFSGAMASTLLHSIQFTRDPGLCTLADELFDRYGGVWAAPAVAAALFTLDSEGAYQRTEEILHPKFKLFTGKKKVNEHAVLQDVTWGLHWNGGTGVYEYILASHDPATANGAPRERPERPALPHPLDPRWYDLLMDAGGMDAQLLNLIRPVEGPAAERLGKYLHLRATRCRDTRMYAACVQALIQLGWTDWKDFWVQCAVAQGEVSYYSIQAVLDILPIPGKEKAAQLRKVTDLIWGKKVKAASGRWPDAQIRQMIAQWENTPDQQT